MALYGIDFGILSAADVLNLSVCEIKHEKAKKANDLTNTLHDPRMGPIEDDIICPTCSKTMVECPGHFGHIVLNEHIIHPLPYSLKMVLNFLKCFCFKCSRLAFSSDKLNLLNLSNLKGMKRYNAIVEAVNKVEICWNCGSQIPKFYVNNPRVDPKVMMFYKLLAEKKSKENSIEVSVPEIERVFKGIIDEDIFLFGFNPHRMRPVNLILSIIPVLPTCSRPYVITNGDKCEDDLTSIYRNICKKNAAIPLALTDEDRAKEVRSLAFYLSVLFDNSKGRVKQPNGRPKKGIKERMAGKGGLFRGNLMAKRTNYSARTVVGGDPTLKADEIGVPLCVSTVVTIPEVVCRYNLDRLQRLVNTKQVEYIIRTDTMGEKSTTIMRLVQMTRTTPLFFGDKVYRAQRSKLCHDGHEGDEEKEIEVKISDISQLRDGDRIVRNSGEEVIAEVGRPREYKLQIGDKVHRHIQNGDWIVINRQPSLHVGSLIGGRAKIMPFGRTIRTPLNFTTPMNMDYDGDETNLHFPQTIEAKAEYQELLSAGKNIVSGQSSRPIMGVVQDCLVGSYLMTQGWVKIKRERFFDICTSAQLDIDRFNQISRIYTEIFPDQSQQYGYHPYLFTGRGILSMCFPPTFNYILHNKAYPSEPYLKIRNGVIIEGSLDKSSIGPKAGAVHHYLNGVHGIDFLTKIQHTVNNWIRDEGVSVGVQDCIPTTYDPRTGMIPTAAEHMEKCYFRAQIAETTQKNPRIAEMKVTSALNAARDMGQRLAKESIPASNRFLPLILSGSKGSLNNTTQIIAALGQQSVGGERMEETCLEGNRTLPHYDPETWTLEQKYESRGFVRHSFFCGLNPQEFWSHASGSREGTTNTSTTTGKVGYFQRRISEFMKNLKIEYDGTIRTTKGRVVQFFYGGDGISPAKQHRMDGGLGIHLGTSIEALNAEFEMECFENGVDMSTLEEEKVHESSLQSFRKTHQLKIDTSFTSLVSLGADADSEDRYELSPINSVGSGSGNNTPDSVGTPESMDYDFDD